MFYWWYIYNNLKTEYIYIMNKQHVPLAKKIKNYSIKHIKTYNFTGIIFAGIFFCVSLMPSLLPRPWLYQGLISGVSVAVGYGFGTFISFTVRWLTQKEIAAQYKKYAWVGLLVCSIPIGLTYLILGYSWQNNVRKLVGEQSLDNYHMFRIVLITVILSWILITISRTIKRFTIWLGNKIDKIFPRRLSIALSVFAVMIFAYWLVNGILLQTFIDVSNNIYRSKNATTLAGVTKPTEPTRSGSPESLIKWDTLGFQGRTFAAGGASQQQLSEYTGQPAKQQIRIYAGLDSATDAKSRADLALKDLERAGGFDRKVLVVATATGTGWLEPQSVDSIEYMYGGDTAIISQQYSYLPSWISFLVDKQKATDAGQALFDAVYGKWASMPEGQRPKLITYGLSLGSFGGQSAFSGVNDLKYRTDGALFMGTPSDTSLWGNITAARDIGSPEWQPIYQNSQTVRFAASNDDITKNQTDWQYPRVLYMQHASDPVVWFNFNLPLNNPDWLKEKRGPDVSPAMTWFPIVTSIQVAVDQFFGVNVPNGHGHNYPNTIVNAWASIIAPQDWNTEKAQKLQEIINKYQNT